MFLGQDKIQKFRRLTMHLWNLVANNMLRFTCITSSLKKSIFAGCSSFWSTSPTKAMISSIHLAIARPFVYEIKPLIERIALSSSSAWIPFTILVTAAGPTFGKWTCQCGQIPWVRLFPVLYPVLCCMFDLAWHGISVGWSRNSVFRTLSWESCNLIRGCHRMKHANSDNPTSKCEIGHQHAGWPAIKTTHITASSTEDLHIVLKCSPSQFWFSRTHLLHVFSKMRTFISFWIAHFIL